MKHSDISIDLFLERCVTTFNRKTIPLKYAALALESYEIITQLRKELAKAKGAAPTYQDKYVVIRHSELGHPACGGYEPPLFCDNVTQAEAAQADWHHFLAGHPCNGDAIIAQLIDATASPTEPQNNMTKEE